MEEWDSPGGLIVAGHGRLGDRRRAGARGARRPRVAADRGRARLRPAAVGHAGHDRAAAPRTRATPRRRSPCYDAAGFVGARRVVVTTGGRLAEQARADGVPVIPVPGGFQPRAAVAYMTVAALEVAAQCGCGPRMASEIDVAASHAEALAARVGPRRPRRLAAQGDRARDPRQRPDDRRRRDHRADRLPLEDPDQREREVARLRARAAGARPQRDRRLGGRRRPRPVLARSCSTTPTCTRACATGSS